MTVSNAASGADNGVLSAINDRLHQELRAEPEQIQVDVVDGQVTLVGTVDSSNARAKAEELVRAVPGVTYVLNNLRVAQAGTTGATG